jgi:hypothetical protein
MGERSTDEGRWYGTIGDNGPEGVQGALLYWRRVIPTMRCPNLHGPKPKGPSTKGDGRSRDNQLSATGNLHTLGFTPIPATNTEHGG